MDKEVLLKQLNSMQTENTIIKLESELEQQKVYKTEFATKSKKILKEIVQVNTKLIHQKSRLQREHNELKNKYSELEQAYKNNLQLINNIPKFILKMFSRKNKVLLLDKGILYEEKFKKTRNN